MNLTTHAMRVVRSRWHVAGLLQRAADRQREQRIRCIADAMRAATAAGKTNLARAYWLDLKRECEARSAAQVARMERSGGLA